MNSVWNSESQPPPEPQTGTLTPIHHILRIPAELISVILHFLLDGLADRIPSLQLVCQKLGSKIRQIAFSDPTLWSIISVEYKKVTRFHVSALDRAKACPLDVSMTIYSYSKIENTPLQKFTTTFLVAPSKRLKSFRVQTNDSKALGALKGILASLLLPQLQHLNFNNMGRVCLLELFHERNNLHLPSAHAPLLQSLVLEKAALDLADGPFPQLHELTVKLSYREDTFRGFPLQGFPDHRIAHMLSQSPNLEVLKLKSQSVGGMEFIGLSSGERKWTDVINMSKLHTLRLMGIDILCVGHLLNHIDAPNLDDVTITRPIPSRGMENQPYQVAATSAFPSVKTLRLEENRRKPEAAGTEYHLALCKWFPGIETLTMPITLYKWLQLWKEQPHWKDLERLEVTEPQNLEPRPRAYPRKQPPDHMIPWDENPDNYPLELNIHTNAAKAIIDFIQTRNTDGQNRQDETNRARWYAPSTRYQMDIFARF